MRQKRTIPFEVTGMDSLGQGVSKISDKVTFIPKTAPGDKGVAQVMAERKGVIFARQEKLTHSSELRIKPICEHYSSCPSCHYLHLSYEDEIRFKKENFERLFRKLPLPAIQIITSPRRVGYRNRIQLHYSLKTELLGMKDPQTFQIIPVPHCLIGEELVLKEVKRLYQDARWMKEAPASRPEGHVEIYLKETGVETTWNGAYAHGGFTQVYQEMNQMLRHELETKWKYNSEGGILDLFAGNGNLSQNLKSSKRLCIDQYQEAPAEGFIHQDLYAKDALPRIQRELEKRNFEVQNLLLDPPRSGMKDLNEWVLRLKPQFLAYVSCDPHTMVRDLMALSDYVIKSAYLIDFFPSTFHFESMIFLERKS